MWPYSENEEIWDFLCPDRTSRNEKLPKYDETYKNLSVAEQNSLKKIINNINSKFKNSNRFLLDTEYNSLKSFYKSDIMISDWSGSALEFSFGLCKPVLFIDTPKKILNKKCTLVINHHLLWILFVELWLKAV